MTPALFHAFRDLAYAQAGIHLRDGKEALLETRIARRMRELGMEGAADYLDYLRKDASGEEMIRFLDSISTNFTSFFREADQFDVLAAEAQRALAQGVERFRVWSVASSSGEEPYSIALTLAEVFAGRAIDYRILATDISTKVLSMAREGRYTERQIAPVPKALRSRHFSRVGAQPDGEAVYRISDALRSRVVFKRLNLAKPPFPMQGPLDVIMCRNVMIYFDQRVRQQLVSELERLLRPGCLLMVGHSETLSGITTKLSMVRPAVYRKPGSEWRS